MYSLVPLEKLCTISPGMHVVGSINDDSETYYLIIMSWQRRFTLKTKCWGIEAYKNYQCMIFPSFKNGLMTVHHLISKTGFANMTVRDTMYHKILLINLLPMIPQSLGNMFLFGLSEREEHN